MASDVSEEGNACGSKRYSDSRQAASEVAVGSPPETFNCVEHFALLRALFRERPAPTVPEWPP